MKRRLEAPLVAFIAVFPLACRGAPEPTERRISSVPPIESPPPPKPRTQASAEAPKTVDACAFIEERAFVSTRPKPCGPPLDDGAVPSCLDRLTFEGTTYHWQTMDMLFSGNYSCLGAKVVGTTDGDEHRGTIDVHAATIVWEGTTFVIDPKHR